MLKYIFTVGRFYVVENKDISTVLVKVATGSSFLTFTNNESNVPARGRFFQEEQLNREAFWDLL